MEERAGDAAKRLMPREKRHVGFLRDRHGEIFERQHGDHMAYPLVMTNIAIENHLFLMGKLIISMAMFNSYVKLPEGLVKDARNDMVYMVY